MRLFACGPCDSFSLFSFCFLARIDYTFIYIYLFIYFKNPKWTQIDQYFIVRVTKSCTGGDEGREAPNVTDVTIQIFLSFFFK